MISLKKEIVRLKTAIRVLFLGQVYALFYFKITDIHKWRIKINIGMQKKSSLCLCN